MKHGEEHTTMKSPTQWTHLVGGGCTTWHTVVARDSGLLGDSRPRSSAPGKIVRHCTVRISPQAAVNACTITLMKDKPGNGMSMTFVKSQ